MNGKEYIQACKEKLKIDSNYKLANELDIRESDLNFYNRGERALSVYACFKIAECLGIDPAEIIADVNSESEKNPHKRNYFKSFMLFCTKATENKQPLIAFVAFIYGAAIIRLDDIRIMKRYAK